MRFRNGVYLLISGLCAQQDLMRKQFSSGSVAQVPVLKQSRHDRVMQDFEALYNRYFCGILQEQGGMA